MERPPAGSSADGPPPPLHPWRRVSLVPDTRSGLPTPKHRVVASAVPVSPNNSALEVSHHGALGTVSLGALSKLLDDLHHVQQEVLLRAGGQVTASNPVTSPLSPGLALPGSEPPSGGVSPVPPAIRSFESDVVLAALDNLDAAGTRFVARELLLSVQRYLRVLPMLTAAAGAGRQWHASRLPESATEVFNESSGREASDLYSAPLGMDVGRRRDSCFSIMSAVHQMPVKATTQLYLSEHADGEAINQLLIVDDIVTGVKLCLDQEAKEYRVVKVIRRPHRFGTAERTLEEIAIWKKLRHKNIVTLHEVIDDPTANYLYLVMQYVEHGPLVETIEDPIVHSITCNAIEPFRMTHYARQIAAGLAYLHNHGVVHNDIKPGNILLGRDDHVYLADFGVSEFWSEQSESPETPLPLGSRQVTEQAEEVFTPTSQGGARVDGSHRSSSPTTPVPRRVGTRAFFAPEVLDPTLARPAPNLTPAELREHWLEVGKAGDVWALGITLFMMLTGHLPFVEPPPRRSLRDSGPVSPTAKSTGTPKTLRNTQTYPSPVFWERYQLAVLSAATEFPPSVPPQWRELIAALLQKDYKRRIDIHTVRAMIKSLKLPRESQAASEPLLKSEQQDSAESSMRLTDSRRASTTWISGSLNRPRLVPLVTREIETAVTIRREPTRAYKEFADEAGLSCTEVPLSSHPVLRRGTGTGLPPSALAEVRRVSQGTSGPGSEKQPARSEGITARTAGSDVDPRCGKTTSPPPSLSRSTSPVAVSGSATPVPITLDDPNQETA